MKYIFILFLFVSFTVAGQDNPSRPSDGAIWGFSIGLGTNVPVGLLNKRYGTNLNFGLSPEYITPKDWIINGDFIYLFGSNVKEDPLAPFRTSSGTLLGDDNQIADVFLRERGMYLGIGGGKLFTINNVTRSGLKITINAGILQHKIRFVDERNSLAQLRVGRDVGYDRLTRGFSIKETIAYKHLSLDRRLNFELAFDCIQGFTSEVRDYNFDTGQVTNKSRFDILLGLRLMWTVPYYTGGAATVYY